MLTAPRATRFRRELLLPAFLWFAGGAIMAAAVMPGLLGEADGGQFGLMRGLGVLMGFALLLHGVSLASPAGRATLQGWRSASIAAAGAIALKFSVVAAQLALLALLAGRFRIENPAFYEKLLPLTLGGFVLHHLLPLRYRLSFFLALSLTALLVIFGPADALWLVGIGLALVAICHLPLPFAGRVALLLVAAGTLAGMRAKLLPTPWPGSIWAILASMFMFRLMLYMYELRHSKEPFNLSRTLSYFFLLPNVAFPLFPVVDFATFRRTYYDQDAFAIYQRGIRWMLRGVIQLLLYRLVYQHLVISQAEVTTAGDLARFLLANFLLYLRVSGQFHLVVGILHLFGFRLPETHRFFYLASSFADFWRRINVYWKDFMMKLVYYPIYFRLRKRGDTLALVLSTLAVFAATWFLHAYQWFWLLGRFLLSWPDVLFWTLLAGLLVANSLREVRRGRQRTLGTRTRNTAEVFGLALRTAGTFVVICVLWSLWTSPTLPDWIDLWRVPDLTPAKVVLAAAVLLTAALGFIVLTGNRIQGEEAGAARQRPAIVPAAAATGSAILLLYLLGSATLASRLGVRGQELIRDLKVTELNAGDAALLQRGYYEELAGVNRFNSQLWEVYSRRSTDQKLLDLATFPATKRLNTFLKLELRPMMGLPYLNGTFRTNRWGMRDQDYTLEKPANSYRIAVLGPSHVVGWGVGDFETFEGILERELNRRARAGGGPRYEVLNFGVPGYSVLQQLMILESKVFQFQPDAVYLFVTPRDVSQAARNLIGQASRGVPIPFDYLREVARAAGITAKMPDAEGERRLKPYQDEMVRETYRRFAAAVQARGARPVWVYLPLPGEPGEGDTQTREARWAAEAGFHLLDLSRVYDGQHLAAIQVAPGDDLHPNAAGHRMIAQGMLQALLQRLELLGLQPNAGMAP